MYVGGQPEAVPGATAGAAAFERFWAVLPPAANGDEGLLPPAAMADEGLSDQVQRIYVATLLMLAPPCRLICHVQAVEPPSA